MKKLVIALGGNALQEAGQPATAEAQLAVLNNFQADNLDFTLSAWYARK